jgi:hypothetical protein
MGEAIGVILVLAAILFPFAMMPLLWRRMKRVRAQTYDRAEPVPHQQPWQEPLETRDGLELARSSSPNDELIALGAKGTHSRWPLDNG